MSKKDKNEYQQLQLIDSDYYDSGKQQIEREIVRQVTLRMLLLVALIVPVVACTTWYIATRPVTNQVKISTAQKTAQLAPKQDAIRKRVSSIEATSTVKTPVATTITTLDQAAADKSNADTVILIGLGNMALSGKVGDLVISSGPEAPVSAVKQILQTGDVIAGSLQSPFSASAQASTGNYSLYGLPEAAKGMRAAGINVVSLANSEIMSFGQQGLFSTTKLLEQYGITHAGAGSNLNQAYTCKVLEIKGKRIAFLAFSPLTPAESGATLKTTGIAADLKWRYLKPIIQAAANHSDYLVLLCDWGGEYDSAVRDYQRTIAKRAIDAGADIIIGGHPHTMQGIELYNGKFIAYSPGDFVYAPAKKSYRDAFIIKLKLAQGRLAGAEVMPIVVDPSGKPTPATGCTAKEILTKLQGLSAPFGTIVSISGDKAQVT
ncbi:MAG TPA: CapA family protein [Candidatus Aquicultor sp.]|jgi:poly-gamma-glutamate synthesis protein (capsule biosynthesis protein)